MSFCKVLQQFAVKSRVNDDGMNAHVIPFRGRKLQVISSVDVIDGQRWEHVSVSLIGSKKCPDWDTMCFIKAIFWGDEDEVIQIHPKRAEYVNLHPGCLHLWRILGGFPWEKK